MDRLYDLIYMWQGERHVDLTQHHGIVAAKAALKVWRADGWR